MWICICNSLNDKEITKVINMGITKYEDILGYYGCKPGCRRCCPTIENMVSNHHREKSKE
jgi:bacterioferritin-associated ferredoxin